MIPKKFKATVHSLLLLSAFCFISEMLRVCCTQTTTYLFMPWNLALAWAPIFFALAFVQTSSRAKALIYFLCWLIFFPNAPYIITDLLHLKAKFDFPFWFDTILLYSYALTGLILGTVSALIVYERVSTSTNRLAGRILLVLTMLLSGYGIYAGRYLRLNSWDILNCPFEILTDACQRIAHPATHLRTYGLMIMTGTLLYLFFAVCESLMLIEKNNPHQ